MANAWFLMGLAVLLIAGCASTQPQVVESSGPVGQKAAPAQQRFFHCVYFTFKPGTPDADIDSVIADCYKSLGQIPSVRQIHAGRRDARMTRDVNVTDYTVGLLVVFDDKAGHDIYNDHPLHKKFVENHKEKWAGVKVYDFDAR